MSPLALIAIALAVQQQPPDVPKALAEFVTERNAESMIALASISYDFTEIVDIPSPRGKRPYHDERHGVYRGNSRGEFMETSWAVRTLDVNETDLGDFARTDRYVVNAEYLAHWTVDSITPGTIFYRDGTGGFSKRAEAELGVSGADRQHLFAFGPGKGSLKAELESLSALSQMRYIAIARRISDANHANLYELEWGYLLEKNNGRSVPVYRFTLDGDRGFLVVHGVEIYCPGVTLQEWTVEPTRDAAEKPWYPKTIRYRRWKPVKYPATQPADMIMSHEWTTTIEHLKTEVTFQDSDFQFVALGMPDGNVMCTHGDDGSNFRSFYVDGIELMPVETEQERGTELSVKADELMSRRAEESRTRKPVRPATQPSDP